MKGVIIRKGISHFTFLKEIFHGINNVQRDYNWLITDHECYPQNASYAEIFSSDYCWLSGDELTEIIEHENFQWIWGVFSAFPKNISVETIMKEPLPIADGNCNIWKKPVTLQHPLAEIEIIAWDSAMTVVISRNNEIVHALSENIPLVEDLAIYNKK